MFLELYAHNSSILHYTIQAVLKKKKKLETKIPSFIYYEINLRLKQP